LKGVSPSFFPLELNKLISPKILDDRQAEFIYFVPSFRGETLKFDGKDYVSEGDPTDSWDGATDDSLAFLNAALSITPQADLNRIAVFGKSRGGALAMLAGIRDKRIKQVVSWSGPVDWFELMGANGWPERAIVADALLKRVEPQEDGGQFVRTFLTGAIRGERDLAQVRLHMIESSPLYFTSRLPETQAYYGVEDRMVPVRNGRALEEKLKSREPHAPPTRVFYHADAGHDLDPKLAYPGSKRFLLQLLPVQ
jgi:acetyl esterase/lipase